LSPGAGPADDTPDFGLLVQSHSVGAPLPDWTGAVPWIIIAIYLLSPTTDASPPEYASGTSSHCSSSATASP